MAPMHHISSIHGLYLKGNGKKAALERNPHYLVFHPAIMHGLVTCYRAIMHGLVTCYRAMTHGSILRSGWLYFPVQIVFHVKHTQSNQVPSELHVIHGGCFLALWLYSFSTLLSGSILLASNHQFHSWLL